MITLFLLEDLKFRIVFRLKARFRQDEVKATIILTVKDQRGPILLMFYVLRFVQGLIFFHSSYAYLHVM